MDLLSHDAFGRLRLGTYVKSGIVRLNDWEFRGALWTGEGHGFTEFLCPEGSPSTVQSISIDLNELPAVSLHRLLADLGLSLTKGMSQAQVDALLGAPTARMDKVPGRTTSTYDVRGPAAYRLFCTVMKTDGLTYLTMMATLK